MYLYRLAWWILWIHSLHTVYPPYHAYSPLIQFMRLTTPFPRSLEVSILYVIQIAVIRCITWDLKSCYMASYSGFPENRFLGKYLHTDNLLGSVFKNNTWKEKKEAGWQSWKKLNCNVFAKETSTNTTGCSVLWRLFRGVPSGGRWDQYIVSCIYVLLDVGHTQGQAIPWAKMGRTTNSQFSWKLGEWVPGSWRGNIDSLPKIFKAHCGAPTLLLRPTCLSYIYPISFSRILVGSFPEQIYKRGWSHELRSPLTQFILRP